MMKLFESVDSNLVSVRARVSYKVVLALYLLALLWLVLFKFSLSLSIVEYPIRTLNLIPFADASKDNLSEMFFNLIAFIPLGLLLNVSLKQANLWRKLAVVFSISFAVEMIQLILVIGITDITDVITNTAGGFFGLLFYDLGNRYITKEKLDCFIATASAILLISLIGMLLTGTVKLHLDPPDGHMPLGREEPTQ